jgi:squalene synthase HpnC
VFVALAETVRQFEIPRQPFEDLLAAFRQDQQVKRYQTIEEQLAYCRYSANPVGRLVLCLAGCDDERRAELSDHICTGLQLANFCQDVARDWDRGRIYLPLEVCRKFGLSAADFTRRQASEPFRRMLASEVQRAEGFLRAGAPLVELMPRGFRVDVELFVRGGLATLEEIRRQDYDVWRCRPTLGRRRKASLIFACLTSRLLPQRRPR